MPSSLSTVSEGKVTVLKSGVKSIEEEKVLAIIEEDYWRKVLYTTNKWEITPKKLQKWVGNVPDISRKGDIFTEGVNNAYLKLIVIEEEKHLLQEIHTGCCGTHTGA